MIFANRDISEKKEQSVRSLANNAESDSLILVVGENNRPSFNFPPDEGKMMYFLSFVVYIVSVDEWIF